MVFLDSVLSIIANAFAILGGAFAFIRWWRGRSERLSSGLSLPLPQGEPQEAEKMPEIHSKARDALSGHLRRALFACRDGGGASQGFPMPRDAPSDEHFTAFCKEALKVAGKWASSDDLWTATMDVLIEHGFQWKLEKKPSFSADGVPDEVFVLEVEAKILTLLERLPLTYTVTIATPNLFLPRPLSIALSNNVSLVMPAEEQFNTVEPISFTDESSTSLRISYVQTSPAAFTVKAAGLALRSMTSSAIRSALSDVKKVVVLGLATGVFAIAPRPQRAATFPGVTFSSGDVAFSSLGRDSIHFRLPVEWGALMDGLMLSPEVLAALANGDEGVARLRAGLMLATNLIEAPADHDNVRHVSAAVEWAFEALMQSNETMEFVQTCIALEALLGSSNADAERYGVTAQLADRCAFLLGKGRSEREEIRERFAALYAARSKLVHGVTAHLSAQDAIHLHEARSLLHRLLLGELRHLPRQAATRESS